MSKKIVPINEFANRCGFFANECIEKNIDVNNGYNCRHPKQEEYEEIEGYRIGKCFSWSCPLCYYADEEDFKNRNIDNQNYEYEENEFVVVDE